MSFMIRVIYVLLVPFLGESIIILTGKEIDGTYLDSNEEEIKKHFQKFKKEWPTHGINLMCDLWTGPTGISIINFMIYYNGVMFFTNSLTLQVTIRTHNTFLE
jgi:hypothetical protein